MDIEFEENSPHQEGIISQIYCNGGRLLWACIPHIFGDPHMTALPAGWQIRKESGKLAWVRAREWRSQILPVGKITNRRCSVSLSWPVESVSQKE